MVTATLPLAASGRRLAENGVHMLGNYTPKTIWGAAVVLETELSIDDLRQVVFPHPTVFEGIREAT